MFHRKQLGKVTGTSELSSFYSKIVALITKTRESYMKNGYAAITKLSEYLEKNKITLLWTSKNFGDRAHKSKDKYYLKAITKNDRFKRLSDILFDFLFISRIVSVSCIRLHYPALHKYVSIISTFPLIVLVICVYWW